MIDNRLIYLRSRRETPPRRMIDLVKSALWRVMRAVRLDSLYVVASWSALANDGWFRSYREARSVDREGLPLPWITYPAIEFLSRRVTAEMDVFEYGSGASTFWWASRARSVHSVEHDSAWYREIASRLPANAHVEHVSLDESGAYAAAILRLGRLFDLVIIDGRDRVASTRASLGALAERGVIVFDNSDRADYAPALRCLAERGFRSIDFVGMAPIAPHKTQTTVFYRPGNCLGI